MTDTQPTRLVTYGPGGHDPDAPDHNVLEVRDLDPAPAEETESVAPAAGPTASPEPTEG